MKLPSSIRDLAGPLLGAGLGLCFGYAFRGHSTTIEFVLFALVIVPIVLWISPKRPLLGWQLPIIAFTISFEPTLRDYPGEPFDLASDLLMTVFVWTGLLLLSSPWALFLLRRAQQARSVGEQKVASVGEYAVAVSFVILLCLLILCGWVMVFAPHSSVWTPPGGFLIGSIGIAACIFCDRIASGLGTVRKDVRQFVVAALALSPLMALGGGHHGSQVGAGPSSVVFGGLLALESVAVLIWMFLRRSQHLPNHT